MSKSPSLVVQKFLNRNVGNIFTTKEIKALCGKKSTTTITTYLYNLKKQEGYIEQIAKGKYLVLKEVDDLKMICYSPKKLSKQNERKPLDASQVPTKTSSYKHKKMIKKASYTEHYDSGKMLIECSFAGLFSCFITRGVDVVCIPGPNVERHIQLMATNIAKEKGKLILVDRDHEVMKRYYDIMTNPIDHKIPQDLKERIMFSQGNIMDVGYYHAPYQDIDLMSSWSVALPIFKKRLSRQIIESPNTFSCIIGTVQETMKEGKSNLEWLNELLSTFQSPISKWNVTRDLPVAGPYLRSYEVPCIDEGSYADETFYRLIAFKYKDDVKPMFTFQLIYKTEEARKYLLEERN